MIPESDVIREPENEGLAALMSNPGCRALAAGAALGALAWCAGAVYGALYLGFLRGLLLATAAGAAGLVLGFVALAEILNRGARPRRKGAR